MDNKEIIARVTRPLNHKSPAAAIIAFVLDLAGNIIRDEKGEPEALEVLKKKVGKKGAGSDDSGRVAELERELAELRAELAALRDAGNQGGQAAGEAG